MRARRLLSIGLMAFLAVTISTPGHSQAPSENEEFLLEDTVVTATKREESIQDIPISVTAFSGDRIKDLEFFDTIDITQQTPGFNLIQFHPTVTTLVLRGISQNDFSDHYEAPVAAYFDDAYLANMSAVSTQMFDLERVEVLRGPQGTLFGRNATGGLVHYISAAPTEDFETYGRLTIGNYETVRFEGAISGSLADNLQARLSGTYHRNDGFLENDIGEDLQNTDVYALRLQFAWQPTDSTNVRLKLQHSKDDTRGNAYSHDTLGQNEKGQGYRLPPGTPDYTGWFETDGDVWRGSFNDIGFFDREINGANLRINTGLSPDVSLVSITDYHSVEKGYTDDTDAGPNPFFFYWQNMDFTQFSQELRFNIEKENYRWQTGLYYLDIDSFVFPGYRLDFFPFGAGTDYGQAVNVHQAYLDIESRSWAVFTEGEFDFNEQLSLTLGLRYTDDERDQHREAEDNFSPYPPGNPYIFDDSLGWDNWSYRAILNWRPSEGTLLFAGVNQTHKAGNWNLDLGGFDPSHHDEEELRSFEMGIKTDLMGGRVRLNATAFYYDYTDYQAFVIDPEAAPTPENDVVNHDADAYGGELELSAYLTKGLYANLGIALMESTVEDVTLPDFSVIDSELPYAPPVAVNGLVRYSWLVGEGEATIQFDFNYSDEFSFSVLRAPIDLEESYFVGNLRASYTFPNQTWKITAFAKNLFEEEYRLYTVDMSGLSIAPDIYAPPRQFGLTVAFNF